MKFILLAAGRGSRLSPITDSQPKCLTPFKTKPIIDYTINGLKSINIKEFIIISGYKSQVLENHIKSQNISFKIFTNENYNSTNMVYSLFKAREEFDDDLIICYSDIIFTPYVLKRIIECKSNFATIIDTDWLSLWNIRMENPLDDVETLKLDINDNIIEIGLKPKSLNEVEGQFIGLTKVSKSFLPTFIKKYDELETSKAQNIHFTGFLQHLLEEKIEIKAVKIHGEWIEIDSIQDLKNYNNSTTILNRLGLKI